MTSKIACESRWKVPAKACITHQSHEDEVQKHCSARICAIFGKARITGRIMHVMTFPVFQDNTGTCLQNCTEEALSIPEQAIYRKVECDCSASLCSQLILLLLTQLAVLPA